MLARIREVYEIYGFAPLETPAIEYTEALGSSCATRTGRMKAVSRYR